MFWLNLILIYTLVSNGYSYRDFGESCDNNDECMDHRLICEKNICTCNQYHKWIVNECVQIVNTSLIMENEIGDQLEGRDLETVINNYNDQVFYIQLMAGLFVAVVYCLAIVVVMIYCCYVRKSDADLKKTIKAECKLKRTDQKAV